MTEKLIVFTRYPEAGKTKTRLIPVLGAEGAASLQRNMTESTLVQAEKLLASRHLSIEMFFAGGDQELMKNWLGDRLIYRPQSTGDLGVKMQQAIAETFASSATKIVIIGTDCPKLTPAILDSAFASLTSHDLVLGKTEDGGYYLIGLSRPIPQLFIDIAWGTELVFQQTVNIAKELNLTVAYLPILYDLDRPEDLERYQKNYS
jgi:uncharacterized protein